MKKLINFIKGLSPFAILILIMGLAIIIVYFTSKYVDNPSDPITKSISEKIDTYKDKVGKETARIETNKQSTLQGIDPDVYARALVALDIKDSQIQSLTDLNAKYSDSFRLAKVTIDEQNNKKWEWEKKYESGSIVKSVMSEKDSILHSDIDIKLQTTDYIEKKGLFRKDVLYTDIYSPDQNIKVNGVKTFRRETIIKPKRIGIGIQVGYGLTGEGRATPYVGVGLSYNLVNL